MQAKYIRKRREYLYSKSQESVRNALVEKKRKIKECIENNLPVPTELAGEIDARERLNLEDDQTLQNIKDDEYRDAATKDPIVLITTSAQPSTPCVLFAKELKLIIPNSIRMNRGDKNLEELVQMCHTNAATDLIEIGGADSQGKPTQLTVSHFPFGPTAHFSLTNVVLRHDLEDKAPPMSLVHPHLIFENLNGRIGPRVCSILKYLFPPPGVTSNRVLSFVNKNDAIFFRHHIWESNAVLRRVQELGEELSAKERDNLTEKIELKEIGPQFTLIPYKIIRGTIETKDADVEWARNMFLNKAAKQLGL